MSQLPGVCMRTMKLDLLLIDNRGFTWSTICCATCCYKFGAEELTLTNSALQISILNWGAFKMYELPTLILPLLVVQHPKCSRAVLASLLLLLKKYLFILMYFWIVRMSSFEGGEKSCHECEYLTRWWIRPPVELYTSLEWCATVCVAI